MESTLVPLRLVLTLLLLTAGILAVKAFDAVPAARRLIEQDMPFADAIGICPLNVRILLKWEHSLRLLTVFLSLAAISGVWVFRTFTLILSWALPSSVIIFAVPLAIRETVRQATFGVTPMTPLQSS